MANRSALLVPTCLGAVFLACVCHPLPGQSGEPDRREQWPHWRGPDATGAAPRANPPLKWSETENIAWKTPIPGKGSATPIVWGDQVFVVTAQDTGRPPRPDELPKFESKLERKTTPPTTVYRFVVMALDRATGKVRWQKTAAEAVPHEGIHASHSYAAGSPTTDGKHLYVSFGSFGIYCYTLDGTLKWSRNLGRLSTRLGWGEAVTPVLHKDDLILNWDQEENAALIVLDARTGATRLKIDRDEKSSWNTPLVVEHKGVTQVILNGKNRVRSYDRSTGKPLWTFGPMTVNAIPSILAADGVAYCLAGYNGAIGAAIPLESRGEVPADAPLWRIAKGTPYVPSALLSGDRLIFTSGNTSLVTILDRKTGKTLVDRERLPTDGQFYASPVAAAGRIYLVNRDGVTQVLRDADRVELLATNVLDDPIDASPAAVGRHLFLRSHGHVYCIESK